MKKNNKVTITSVVVALLLVAVIAVAIVMTNTNNNLNKQIEDLKTEKTLTAEDFQVGGINEKGKLDSEEEYAIMTMNYHKVDGVKIEFEPEDTTILYKLFYYTQDKELIGKTEYLKADFAGTIPENAVYFRVMVNTDETKATEDNKEALLAPLTITVQKK